jgi:hypothetical protein
MRAGGGIDVFADAVTARLQEPTMNAWNGVPFMCDVMCFMATVDLPLLGKVTSPTEVLNFALDAMYRRNVPSAVMRWPWLANEDVLGNLRGRVFSVAREKALQVYETGSNVVRLDLSTFDGRPTNVAEFVLAQTGWLQRRSDVTDGAGAGDRYTNWYFAHRCFLEYLAATRLSTGEAKELEAWMKRNISLNPGERMVLSLLCHEISFRQLKRHREVVLDLVHATFLKNYGAHREAVLKVLAEDPTYQERERLWELTGALIAVEVGVVLNDDRIALPKKHLGLVPHMKNPSYFLLLLEPSARFGSLTLVRRVEQALEADKRYTAELASRALAQAIAHSPPSALLAYSLDGGGHRLVIDHLVDSGGQVSLLHACECNSLVAVRKALTSQHTPPDVVVDALSTAVDHGFDEGVAAILEHLRLSVFSGVASLHLLTRGLVAAIARSLVVGQLSCFHAAARVLGSRPYELTIVPRDTTTGHFAGTATFSQPAWVHPSQPWDLTIALNDLPFPFGDRHLARMVEACPNVIALNLGSTGGGSLSDEALVAVALHCRMLRSIDLSETHGAYTDTGACAVFSNVTTLEQINVSGCDGRITDAALETIAATCCGSLKTLDISRNPGGVTDRGVMALSSACSRLEHLAMRECPVTDDAVKVVALRCRSLVTLDAGANGGRITDASVRLIVERCTTLLSLDVGAAEGQVTNASIAAVAQRCPGLRYLNASGSNRAITDSAVLALASGCRDLVHLDLTDGLVTDQGLHALAQGCRNLRSLRLSGNGGLTDRGLKQVSTGCAGLETLHIEGKPHQITRQGLKAIAARCSNLHSVFVTGVTL